MNSKILFASFATLIVVLGAAAFMADSDAITTYDIKESDLKWTQDEGTWYVEIILDQDNLNLKGSYSFKGETDTDFSTDSNFKPVQPVKTTGDGSTEHVTTEDGRYVYAGEVSGKADLSKDTVVINLVTVGTQNQDQYFFSNEKFDITTTNAQNGTIILSVKEAQKGETVTFTVVPSKGYELSGVPTVNGVKATETETGYSFVMPGEAVTISATFTKIVVPVYKVAIDEKIQNGTVTASKTSDIKEGDEVALTADPASDDYTLVPGSLKVLDKDGKDVEVVDNKFKMPASDVTVTAQFALKTPCKVTYDKSVLTVKAGNEVIVSGTTVPAGTEVTCVAVEKLGYDAVVTPALVDGKYTVTKDVEFKVAYTEKEYSQETHSGNIESAVVNEKSQWTITADSVIIDKAVLTVDGKLVVPAGVTLTVAAGATLTVNGVADIQGNLVVEAADTDADPAKPAGVFSVNGEATVAGNVSIEGKIVSAGKVVIAPGSAAEIAGEIAGNYTVSEDASLTIAGGVADVGVDEQFARSFFTVSGKLVVSSDVPTAGFDVKLSGKGAIDIEKVVLGKTSEDVGVGDGEITVTDDGVFYNDKDDKELASEVVKNTIEISGSLTVEASAEESDYKNATQYGAAVTGISISVENSVVKVTEEGEHKGQMKHVSVMSVSGSVAVNEYVYYYETVYDGGKTGPVAKENSISAAFTAVGAEVSTVKIGAALSFGKDIEASLKNVDIASPVTFVKKLTLENAGVNAAVTVPVGAELDVNGTFDVKAAVDASAVDAKDAKNNAKLSVTDGAVVTVSGEGSVASYTQINQKATVNATLYGSYVYVAFDKAVAALNAGTTKAVKVLGEQTLVASAEIPAIANAVTLSEGSHLCIGSEDSTDVVLTVVSGNGVVLKNSKSNGIEVYGTLYAEKMSNVDGSLRNGTVTVGDVEINAIASDVYSCALKTNGTPDANGFAKWTNIYTALAEAEVGQTVTLQRNIDGLKSVEIKAGVVLDADGKTITVAQTAVLTVAGTLDLTDEGSKVVLAEPTMEGEKVKTAGGAIAYTGYIQYTGEAVPVTQENLFLPGAYYTLAGTSTKVLTTYANGAANALKAEKYTVVLKADKDGKIALGEISFIGEKDKIVKITVEKAAVTGTVSLGYADFDVAAESEVDAKFVSGSDSVAVKAKVETDGLCVENAVLGEAAVLMISGALADIDISKADTSVAFDGKVYIAKDFESKVDKTVVNGDLVVCGVEKIIATFETGDLDVVGNIVIQNGSIVKAVKLTVSGSVGIENGILAADVATVSGAIDAKAVDKDGASVAAATFGILYVGVDAEIAKRTVSTGADASVVGNIVVENYALFAPGLTAPESFTKENSGYVSTLFVAEDKDYVVAYAVDKSTLVVGMIDYEPENADFKYWKNAETGESADKEAIGKYAKVVAEIDYQIYKITITTDGGIAYITVDGKLMNGTEKANIFVIDDLVAGSHTVEISPAADYDISKVVLKDKDGKTVGSYGSMSISLSGTEKADRDVSYQLIGSTPAVTPMPEPTPIIIKDDKDDMSLTDILLIVLVVLIVIMAAIVALRMMRS